MSHRGKMFKLELLKKEKRRISLLMQKTQVQSLGLEDPLKKEMATRSSILAWEIPCIDTGVCPWNSGVGCQARILEWVAISFFRGSS